MHHETPSRQALSLIQTIREIRTEVEAGEDYASCLEEYAVQTGHTVLLLDTKFRASFGAPEAVAARDANSAAARAAFDAHQRAEIARQRAAWTAMAADPEFQRLLRACFKTGA